MAKIDKTRVAILGASGYTGADLIRLLALHPHVIITALSAERNAGQPLAAVFPHLAGLKLPMLCKIDEIDFEDIDLVFCCLPHGTTQAVIAKLPQHLRIIDLSADFRLADPALYAEWYGHPHVATELQKTAVYGLAEVNRASIRTARLVANPGCYPTAAQLPLVPLLKRRLIDPDDIIIDAKSGVTGAGRDAKQANLYAEVTEGIHAYGVASHRHAPEIEQGLSLAAQKPVVVNFTPHLMPMSRGILASIYVKVTADSSPEKIHAMLAVSYVNEPFIRILPFGEVPATRHVRGSNYVLIGVTKDRIANRAMIFCAEDNLVKGASGQAVQNMNIMYGWPETTALEQLPLFP